MNPPSRPRRQRKRRASRLACCALALAVAGPFLLDLGVTTAAAAAEAQECVSQDDSQQCQPTAQDNDSSKQDAKKKINGDNENSNNVFHAWFKDVSDALSDQAAINKEGLQFLREKVFGQGEKMKVDRDAKDSGAAKKEPQDPFSHLWRTMSASHWQQPGDEKEKEAESFLGGLSSLLKSESPTDAFLNLVSRSEQEIGKRTFVDIISIFTNQIQEIKEQMHRAFGDLAWNPIEHFRPIAAFYLLRAEEEQKDPVWKRRQHRFFPKLRDVEALKEFHNALYLSELSYSHTVGDIQEGLKRFQNDTWALLFATTDSLPHEPAHFIAVRKTATPMAPADKLAQRIKSLDTILPWENLGEAASKQLSDEDSLEIALVVRGTKDIGDIVSDLLFEPVDYRDGHKAHGGILQAGKYLVDMHVERFRELLNLSGKKMLRLWVFGHSLGGGASSIAAIEFNDFPFIEASAIGFGSPATISSELSAAYQEIITTIISDADIIPRLGISSAIHTHLKMMAYEPGPSFHEDVTAFVQDLRKKLPDQIVDFLMEGQENIKVKLQGLFYKKTEPHVKDLEDYLKNKENSNNLECEPPGTCIHFFRDGTGYTAAYTPCSFFSEIEFVSTLIDDHLVRPGYHRALVTLARDLVQDLDFRFDHQDLPDTS